MEKQPMEEKKEPHQEIPGLTQEQQVASRYKQLHQETRLLMAKIFEIEDEKKEHMLVKETIKDLEATRKCWRLINGVLFEKTKDEMIPELATEISNMDNVIKQINDTMLLKKQEISRLEQMYESIMKQAKEQNSEVKQGEVKSGGVLV
mmetsp:Transcript_16038/g.15454  ORF Transcript_16038/g.15454 Transcript_16038/m.15454 type:complete len:148 (+) Transcript_16038:147-590(+)|eukprot:CAMPEP_0170540720 /NCGR_PEP_ID=MMETSP0211-20121228/671_1 /TAXON_ID=311385 /ORGANISM="Pseudokeronopsis sp., Strain OXSARD2" /LENGTH=147 /DNA_ID=CAMNT_0010843231 /DNA_START=204 /DNA_END=647 /DNA_ORIENTATION=-